MQKRYQDQIHRLNDKFSQLQKLLSTTPKEQLYIKPNPKAWSVLQVIQHLYAAERGTYLYLQKKLQGNPSELPSVDWKSRFREFKLITYLNIPLRWPTPKVVNPVKLEITTDIDELMNDWLNVRQDLFQLMTNLDESLWQKQIQKHPLVGRISLKGTLNFTEVHFDRHFKQIKRTIGLVEHAH